MKSSSSFVPPQIIHLIHNIIKKTHLCKIVKKYFSIDFRFNRPIIKSIEEKYLEWTLFQFSIKKLIILRNFFFNFLQSVSTVFCTLVFTIKSCRCGVFWMWRSKVKYCNEWFWKFVLGPIQLTIKKKRHFFYVKLSYESRASIETPGTLSMHSFPPER